MNKILTILFAIPLLLSAQNPDPSVYMRYGDAKSNTLIVTNVNGIVESISTVSNMTDSVESALLFVTNNMPIVSGPEPKSAVLDQSSSTVLSEGSIALGENSVSGQRAFKYLTRGSVYYSLVLDIRSMQDAEELSKLSVGDVVSIVNGSKYPDCAEIVSIFEDKITFRDSLPFSTIVDIDPSELNFDDYTLYVTEKPNVGTVDLGKYSFAHGDNTKALNYAATAEGRDTLARGEYSHAEGRETTAEYCGHAEGFKTFSYFYAHAEGINTSADATFSHAEGEGSTVDRLASWSHVEGVNSHVYGQCSHAEGWETYAYGSFSHVEGDGSEVHSDDSHAEGFQSKAFGENSHAENRKTEARGRNSHTEGDSTIAYNTSEHAQGQYNVSNKASDTFGDSGNTIHSIGIGTDGTHRTNAVEVMQNGSVFITGVGGYNGTNPAITNSLQAKLDAIDELINQKPLSGKEFDISDNDGLVFAVSNIIVALGGSISPPRKTTFHFNGSPDETYLIEGSLDEAKMVELGLYDGEVHAWIKSPISAEIGSGVTTIDRSAFYNSSLLSVTMPNSVTNIGFSAFNGCEDLTSVTIPNSVTSIGDYAFADCSGLTSVTIPNSVTSIGFNTFGGCEGLTSVTIPNSVTRIGDYAFGACSSLTSVTIPNSVTSISASTFVECSGLTSVTIPNSVTSIGIQAFTGCSGLTSMTIPDSVTSIGWGAFERCNVLTSVTMSGKTKATVQGMTDYSWNLPSGCSITSTGDGQTWQLP